jgi:hypothetical protein
MTEASLKAVFTLDPQTGAFSPAGHNLPAQEAAQKVTELEGQGKKAQILDQLARHRALTFKRCKPCTTAAENLSQSNPGQVLQEGGEDTEAGSEGD